MKNKEATCPERARCHVQPLYFLAEWRGWFEPAPLRQVTSPPNAPYRPLCISFNMREVESNEKLRSLIKLEPLGSCTSAELQEVLKNLSMPEEKIRQPILVCFGESTPLEILPANVEVLKRQLKMATRKFAESPASLLCSLRGTRRIRLELYDYLAVRLSPSSHTHTHTKNSPLFYDQLSAPLMRSDQ